MGWMCRPRRIARAGITRARRSQWAKTARTPVARSDCCVWKREFRLPREKRSLVWAGRWDRVTAASVATRALKSACRAGIACTRQAAICGATRWRWRIERKWRGEDYPRRNATAFGFREGQAKVLLQER